MSGGGRPFVYMPKDEIEAHRARSSAKNSGPWVTDCDAMTKKTMIRQVLKRVPMAPALQHALAGDDDPEQERPVGARTGRRRVGGRDPRRHCRRRQRVDRDMSHRSEMDAVSARLKGWLKRSRAIRKPTRKQAKKLIDEYDALRPEADRLLAARTARAHFVGADASTETP